MCRMSKLPPDFIWLIRYGSSMILYLGIIGVSHVQRLSVRTRVISAEPAASGRAPCLPFCLRVSLRGYLRNPVEKIYTIFYYIGRTVDEGILLGQFFAVCHGSASVNGGFGVKTGYGSTFSLNSIPAPTFGGLDVPQRPGT